MEPLSIGVSTTDSGTECNRSLHWAFGRVTVVHNCQPHSSGRVLLAAFDSSLLLGIIHRESVFLWNSQAGSNGFVRLGLFLRVSPRHHRKTVNLQSSYYSHIILRLVAEDYRTGRAPRKMIISAVAGLQFSKHSIRNTSQKLLNYS